MIKERALLKMEWTRCGFDLETSTTYFPLDKSYVRVFTFAYMYVHMYVNQAFIGIYFGSRNFWTLRKAFIHIRERWI